jgi:hypothetical protein
MDESDMISVGEPLPRIASAKAAAAYGLVIEWGSGDRNGIVETVDLSPLILRFKAYRPIQNDRELFETVHVTADGAAVAWGSNDEIDMPATAIRRLAEDVV